MVVDLTRAYWGWQLLQGLVASLDEGEERLDGVLYTIEELLEADSGQVTENDRLRLKFALSTLSVRRAQAEGGLAQLEQAIRLLIGRSQSAPLSLKRERLEDAIPKSLPPVDELITAARFDRAELRALREVVGAQKAFRELRIAQMFPTLFFGGFVNFAITTNATDQTNPFIKDTFNFFDGGVGLGDSARPRLLHEAGPGRAGGGPACGADPAAGFGGRRRRSSKSEASHAQIRAEMEQAQAT